MFQGNTADMGNGNVCWRIIHAACIAAGSRLCLVLPAHWKGSLKGRLWGSRGGVCLLFFRRSNMVAGKDAIESPFLCIVHAVWQASTAWKKPNHLQPVGQNYFIQWDTSALWCIYSAVQTVSERKTVSKKEIQILAVESLSCTQQLIAGRQKTLIRALSN